MICVPWHAKISFVWGKKKSFVVKCWKINADDLTREILFRLLCPLFNKTTWNTAMMTHPKFQRVVIRLNDRDNSLAGSKMTPSVHHLFQRGLPLPHFRFIRTLPLLDSDTDNNMNRVTWNSLMCSKVQTDVNDSQLMEQLFVFTFNHVLERLILIK